MFKILNNGRTYFVLENEQDRRALGITPVSLLECKPGDYILSRNGYYVPVLDRETRVRTIHKRKMSVVVIVLPNYRLYLQNLNTKSTFYYRRDKVVSFKNLSPKMKMVIKLVQEGCHYDLAIKTIYGARNVKQKIYSLLNNEKFVLLMKDSIMSLQNELINQGITFQSIAEQFKAILDNPKANPALKKYAMEVSLKSLETKAPEQLSTGANMRDEINREMKLVSSQ